MVPAARSILTVRGEIDFYGDLPPDRPAREKEREMGEQNAQQYEIAPLTPQEALTIGEVERQIADVLGTELILIAYRKKGGQ